MKYSSALAIFLFSAVVSANAPALAANSTLTNSTTTVDLIQKVANNDNMLKLGIYTGLNYRKISYFGYNQDTFINGFIGSHYFGSYKLSYDTGARYSKMIKDSLAQESFLTGLKQGYGAVRVCDSAFSTLSAARAKFLQFERRTQEARLHRKENGIDDNFFDTLTDVAMRSQLLIELNKATNDYTLQCQEYNELSLQTRNFNQDSIYYMTGSPLPTLYQRIFGF